MPCPSASQILAISTHFAGDAALYHAFSALCSVQFAHDIRTGDSACAGRDLPRLRRLGHDLRSVCRILGRPDMSALASRLESQAATGPEIRVRVRWRSLRLALLQLPAP